ncbi:alkaline phosphatase family protein [Chungangia koreensis]|uniref:Alkaline phosphatase family protein n=1 Tax=Chungangia koreensis TaxID=752657 RepID=A0ABV8X5N8_9LACT
MKRKILFSIVILLLSVGGLIWALPLSPRKDLLKITAIHPPKKPVIMINVDSLMSGPLMNVVNAGEAPAIKFLMDKGYFIPDMVSSYPTMSMTIDSTILTGTYANQHHVPGLIWFDEKSNEIVSYGSGFHEIWDNGVKDVVKNGILHLNGEHLSKNVSTIHEELESHGLQTASINGLLYRGPKTHQLHVPKMIAASKLLPKNLKVDGPTYLSLGALSHYSPQNTSERAVWNRMGMNNKFTVNEIRHLIRNKRLPSFTLAYFPDMDKDLHKEGPEATNGIVKLDQQIQGLLNEFSSWEEAIEQTVWIVHGDSAQSKVLEDQDKALIDLNKLLDGYRFWTEDTKTDSEIAIAINERMAYIYLNDSKIQLQDVVRKLRQDDRIAWIAYKENQLNVVQTINGEQLAFSSNGPYTDTYGQSWNVSGTYSILDLHVSDQISYGNYPDALARLHGALHSQEGRFLIVEAKPGFEFIESHSYDHSGGGAHGSLHKVDSIVPLIVAGTEERPVHPRVVDLKEWIYRLTVQ